MAPDSLQNTGEASIPGKNEKLSAMFAHLSIFFGGLILPPIFWIIYHDRSKFVVFHSVQSLVFNLFFTFCVFIIGIVLAGIYYSTGILDKNPPPAPGIPMLLFMLVFGLAALVFIFGSWFNAVYLGINAYKGGTKRVPVFGKMVFKKLYA